MNCPNCGAPRSSCKCEYCGTVFEEPSRAYILESETQKLKNTIIVEELYQNAILAMRNYCLTPNEIREMCGLKRLDNV